MRRDKITPVAYALIGAVCEIFRIEPEFVLGNCRRRRAMVARWVLMFLFYRKIGLSKPVIGWLLGDKTRDAVTLGVTQTERLMAEDRMFCARVDAFALLLKLKGWKEILAPVPSEPEPEPSMQTSK